MSEEEGKEIVLETPAGENKIEGSEPSAQGSKAPQLPVVSPSGPLVGAIAVLYIVFVLAVSAGLIALSLFLFSRLWNWLR